MVKEHENKIIGTRLTVIIRDEAPLRHAQCPPAYRRVTIDLTDEQIRQLELKWTDNIGETIFYEEVTNLFFED